MPIPSGQWGFVSGEYAGLLTFSELTGSLSGAVVSDDPPTPFVGFFDEPSQTLTLLFNPQIAEFTNAMVTPFAVLQGSLFRFTPPGTKTVVSVLAGAVSLFTGDVDGPAPVPNPGLLGGTWFAQNPPGINQGYGNPSP
jgi:hypothetical protein